MSDLLGLVSVLFVSVIIISLCFKSPTISKIIFVALIFRILIMLAGHYLISLPDSGKDAAGFEWGAWERAKYGFIYNIDNFPGVNMFFYQWLIAIPYSLFGRSVLMMQSISLLFGVGSVLLGWIITKKIWNEQAAINVAWVIAILPSLALYSILPLREVYCSFFLLIALFSSFKWVNDNSYKSLIIAVFGYIAATLFHGAMIIGGFVFLTFVVFRSLKNSSKLLLFARLKLKDIFIITLAVFFLTSYILNKFSVPKLGKFENLIDTSRLINEVQNRSIGDAAFPDWLSIEKPIEIIYKVPVRMAFFLFSPFPWQLKKSSHLIGMFDGFIYMILVYLIFQNRNIIWKDPALRMILIILLIYIVAFSIGVSNFGAGIRHRSKFVIALVILVAPLIPKFIFKKK